MAAKPLLERFFGLDRAIAQIEFNKIIAGCYRDGNAEYDSVGVLLLTWKDDDMNCREKEVNDLEKLLREKFKFNTEQYEIPPIDSSQSLFNKLYAFYRCYDTPAKLGIVYYGGHAGKKDTPDGIDLELFARRSAQEPTMRSTPRSNTSLSDASLPDSPTEIRERPEQAHISFKAICEQIKTSETDILMVIDTCFAAGAFTDQPFGGRKCELFCSIAEKDVARAPGHEGSFTTILTTTMAKMIAESPEGFSTSDLYRRVYQQQHQMHKPFHFTQSRFDFGRIWLRPCRPRENMTTMIEDSNYTLDVRFHLSKSVDMMELNKMAKSLQWIPFVQTVKLQNMHCPSDDLVKFIKMVYIVRRLRPALTRIRRKLELKRAKQLSRSDSYPPSPCVSTSERFHVHQPSEVSLFDWSKSEAVMRHNERLTSDEYIDRKETIHQTNKNLIVGKETLLANTALLAISQTRSAAEPAEPSIVRQHLANLCLSQRSMERLLIFAMGVLAPKFIVWAVQGSAAFLADS